jgi:hypothetical protein
VRTPQGLLEFDIWNHDGPMATVRAYLYGSATATAAEQERRWSRWLHTTFPELASPAREQLPSRA